MQAILQTDANKVTLKIAGSLNFADNKEWRVRVLEFLEKEGTQHLLDMTELDDLDSAGLGMMLAMQKWGKDRGREVKLKFDPESTAGGMLRLAKFDEMFGSIGG